MRKTETLRPTMTGLLRPAIRMATCPHCDFHGVELVGEPMVDLDRAKAKFECLKCETVFKVVYQPVKVEICD